LSHIELVYLIGKEVHGFSYYIVKYYGAIL